MPVLTCIVMILRSLETAREQSRRAGVPLGGRLLAAFGMMLVMLAGFMGGLFACAGLIKTHPQVALSFLAFAGVWFVGCMVWMIRWGKRDTADINARIAANEALLVDA